MGTQTLEVQDLPAAHRGRGLTVAAAVWVATALLHRGSPERDAFEVETIVSEVMKRNLTEGLEKSVKAHVVQHCVANKKPDPNRACMLFEPGRGVRRLFRPGDDVYPGKNASRTHPAWDDLPAEYQSLREWYEREWLRPQSLEDPLLALAGTWDGESADAYVAKLREGWEERR